MRVLVTGSRDWEDWRAVCRAFADIECAHPGERFTLIHGTCTGADTIADTEAQRLGWAIERHPAKWLEHGKAAGPIRNQEMVDSGADICLAFIKDNSRGATHCANAAEKAGIAVRRFLA
jgi:hypothetical protein